MIQLVHGYSRNTENMLCQVHILMDCRIFNHSVRLVPRFHEPIWKQHIEECTVVKHSFYAKKQSISAATGQLFSVSSTNPALVLRDPQKIFKKHLWGGSSWWGMFKGEKQKFSMEYSAKEIPQPSSWLNISNNKFWSWQTST